MRAVLVAGMGPLTLQASPSKRTYPHGSHVPQPDSCTAAKDVRGLWLFDHLVSASEQRRRDDKAECLGSLQVYHELDFHRLLDRQVGGLFAPEDPTGIVSHLTVRIRQAASISH